MIRMISAMFSFWCEGLKVKDSDPTLGSWPSPWHWERSPFSWCSHHILSYLNFLFPSSVINHFLWVETTFRKFVVFLHWIIFSGYGCSYEDGCSKSLQTCSMQHTMHATQTTQLKFPEKGVCIQDPHAPTQLHNCCFWQTFATTGILLHTSNLILHCYYRHITTNTSSTTTTTTTNIQMLYWHTSASTDILLFLLAYHSYWNTTATTRILLLLLVYYCWHTITMYSIWPLFLRVVLRNQTGDQMEVTQVPDEDGIHNVLLTRLCHHLQT